MRKMVSSSTVRELTVHLCIQDPTDVASTYLIDALLDACSGAIRGAGAFAFLSAGGVKLFLRDTRFLDFSQGGGFDLVIGVDAITDKVAVKALEDVRAERPAVTAAVHLPSHPRSIFHPKVAWFEHKNGGVLITGSGNLTASGLRWNIEAFSVTKLSKAEIQAIATNWQDFKERSASCLFPTDDPKVLALLERNSERKKAQKAEVEKVPGEPGAPQSSDIEPDAVPAVSVDSEVLVAEVPQSGDRWKQVNFDKQNFIDYFGASTTKARTVYFFHVRDDGTVGQQEVRPAVVVASHNYRFELEAAAGLKYPKHGRPTVVFVEVAARTFTYVLAMPGSTEHAALSALLDTVNANPGSRMRRIRFKASVVAAVIPSSPLWKPLTI